jgi:transcriptional regulator GlxA family with amidase domain
VTTFCVSDCSFNVLPVFLWHDIVALLRMSPKRIGFVGFDGAAALNLVGPADAFSTAALDDGYGNRISCYEVCTIGLSSKSFQSESGIVFNPQETLGTAPELDTIVIPGGKGLRRPEINEAISDWILTRANRTRRIACICTGIYGLASTGLLDGRQVTIHCRFARDVAQRFPKLCIHNRPLIKDGPFYTSAGLTAGIDLSLALIEEDYGRHVALATAQELMTPVANWNGEKELPKPLVFDSQPIDRFGDLVAWIVRNLQEDLSVNALARRVCMSPSHFNRAFKSVFSNTPADFVENLRVNEARRRLSTPRRTLCTVAASVGFSSAGEFERAFERRLRAKPTSYLNSFDSPSAMIPLNSKVTSRAAAQGASSTNGALK